MATYAVTAVIIIIIVSMIIGIITAMTTIDIKTITAKATSP
jgi:hypothetical protein